jgi:hypothetical protein
MVRVRFLSCVVVGLLGGVGVFAVPRLFASSESSPPYPLDHQRSVAKFASGIGVDRNAGTFTRAASTNVMTPTPGDAVKHFLDARVAGRSDDAWRVVSDRDHREFPEAIDWEDANGVLPRVTGYTIGLPQAIGDRGQVTGTVSYAPSLDQIAGDVPAHANTTWVVVRERGNWHVSVSESDTEPLYPPDTEAVPVARAWVAAKQQCTTVSQWDGPFVGEADVAARALCHARGDVQVGAVRELDDTAAAESFIAAFGGDVFSWARVVPVMAPTQLDLVLAPIGDQWSVIGAITAFPRSSG